ncbi:MAG TPA: GspH/FimT family pseudopilin [bacterium]|nr:GspH/FimT family pseudopilin [bacterium]
MTTSAQRGFAITELIVAASLVMVMVVLATSRWESRSANLQLRYATLQVVSHLARARQTAEDLGTPLVVTFAASDTVFLVARAGEPLEHIAIPEGVIVAADATITFSPLGAGEAPQTVTLKSPSGISRIQVSPSGMVSYVFP